MSLSWNQPSPDVSTRFSQRNETKRQQSVRWLLLGVGRDTKTICHSAVVSFVVFYHLRPNKPEHCFTRGKLCSETYPLQEALNLHALLLHLVYII